MTYDTLNPVPSIDPRDLDDNAQAFDRLLQSDAATELDRLGAPRKTYKQMERDAEGLVSPNVAALAAVTAAANTGVFFNSASPVGMGTYVLNAFNRSLGSTADGPAFRTAIGAIGAADNITGSADSLANTRTISLTGDATWSVSFNGTANVTAALTLANSGVGAGTYEQVTVDVKGRVTGGVATAAFANLTLQNSWTVSSSRRAVYRKVGDNVQLEVHITGGTSADGTLLATLPAGFRPQFIVGIPVLSGFKNTPSTTSTGPSIDIAPDGTIKCYGCNGATGGVIFFSALIPLV